MRILCGFCYIVNNIFLENVMDNSMILLLDCKYVVYKFLSYFFSEKRI